MLYLMWCFFQITIKAIDNLDNEDQAVSLALSPFIPGEGIVAMTTGEVHIWHLGKDNETRNVPSVAPKEKWPWYQCVYASHPRCIFIANPIEADIMDLRVCTVVTVFFIVLPPNRCHIFYVLTSTIFCQSNHENITPRKVDLMCSCISSSSSSTCFAVIKHKWSTLWSLTHILLVVSQLTLTTPVQEANFTLDFQARITCCQIIFDHSKFCPIHAVYMELYQMPVCLF